MSNRAWLILGLTALVFMIVQRDLVSVNTPARGAVGTLTPV